MENNNNNKKKLTWAVGLIAGLGILSIAYAALSSTLNIKGEDASANLGYVHFTSAEGYGIGSTNSEYTNNGTESGNNLFRTDGENGIIPPEKFIENWAAALGYPGGVFLDITSKKNDTVKIRQAQINDYGTILIYKLDIVNDAGNAMQLIILPDIVVTKKTGDDQVISNIETKLYTKYDPNNFTSPCSEPLDVYDSSSPKVNAPNYLLAGETTTWYLQVDLKNYDKDSNNSSGKTTFDFSVNPRWEAVMS